MYQKILKDAELYSHIHFGFRAVKLVFVLPTSVNMDNILIQPQIVLIYNLARLGIIHARRSCKFCNQPMMLKSYIATQHG